MKLITTAIAVALLCVGCTTLQNLGAWVEGNPMTASIVTRQATARLIDGADDPQARAVRITEVIDVTTVYLDGSPQVTVAELLTVIDSAIQWDRMSTADQLLASDLINIIAIELDGKVAEGKIDPEATIGIRTLLKTARSTAALYANS